MHAVASTRRRADPAFRADVLAGLAAPIPAIPARWFYDRRGSELFEQITAAARILSDPHRDRVARSALRRGRARSPAPATRWSSSARAPRPRRRSCCARSSPAAYVPIDISGEFLRDSADGAAGAISRACRSSRSRPISCARSTLPDAVRRRRKLGFFPGSTIGNMVAAHRRRPAAGDEGDARATAPGC